MRQDSRINGKEELEERENSGEEMWLSVKPQSHFFWKGDRPFFWSGDTAWLMLHKLTREEIDVYLTNRARKGFRVIQTVAVHHLPAQNVYGYFAFRNNDPGCPETEGEDNYWKLMDYVITRARKLEMYVAVLPHWGNLSDLISVGDMKNYIRFLAKRYGQCDNLIWLTGGDTRPDERIDYWKIMGQMLKTLCPRQLISYHPFGRTSSVDFFPDEDWMDFHMFQSGHRRYDQESLGCWDDSGTAKYYGEDNWRYVQDGWNLKRKMPILDGEPSYEHIPQGLHGVEEPYWTPEQVRRYGWWSVLSGAAGFTYGHNSIMQFYTGEGTGAFRVRYPWRDALHGPAAASVVIMADLIQKMFDEAAEDAVRQGEKPEEYMERNCRSCQTMLRKESIWKEEQKEERVITWKIGKYCLFYSYTGCPVHLSLRDDYEMWWFDPSNGVWSWIGRIETACVEQEAGFYPPVGDFSHRDWLLILKEDASR